MFEIINIDKKSKWNSIVNSFCDFDVYYLNEYIEPYLAADKIIPLLIYFKGNQMELCYVVEKSDISDCEKFQGKLEKKLFFDLSTPYGYGGPLVKNYNADDMKMFFDELGNWAKNENIITQFIRFHPILENHKHFSAFSEIKTFKKSVFMDLTDEETIYKNMNDKCRNMIQKASKKGISIVIDNSTESQNTFIELYKQTMERNSASDYYYFNEDFFNGLFSNIGSYCNLFNAVYNNKIISSAIILNCNKNLHYHLSANNREFMHLAPNNLLLFEVANWGAKNGYKTFHLGGGYSNEDGLLLFKKSFNKNGLIDFYIGRNIFDTIKYKELMELRKKLDNNFNMETSYMIGYRA